MSSRWILLCLNGFAQFLWPWTQLHSPPRYIITMRAPLCPFCLLLNWIAGQFQQDAMASQIRYHKARHQQLRQLVERLKRDLSDMKRYRRNDVESRSICPTYQTGFRSYDILQNENEQYKLRFGSLHLGQEPSDLPNMNGKRQMMNTAQ